MNNAYTLDIKIYSAIIFIIYFWSTMFMYLYLVPSSTGEKDDPSSSRSSRGCPEVQRVEDQVTSQDTNMDSNIYPYEEGIKRAAQQVESLIAKEIEAGIPADR